MAKFWILTAIAALVLACAGLKPIVLERGQDADTRKADLDAFFSGAPLKSESNVQFGEGGGYAGGIMSAAVDGMRVAEQLINDLT